MIIRTSDFITSATKKSQYPEPHMPEVAFVGRSNVGKSSLINSITGRRALARVSNTPGRTRLVNFFLINGEISLVDLPGYGYAKVSKSQLSDFQKIIEEYLENRENLEKIILLVDSRHVPTADDVMMYNYVKHYDIPCVIVGTKLDKLKRNEIKKNEKIIREKLQIRDTDEFVMFSSLSKENKEQLMDKVFKGLIPEEGTEIETDENSFEKTVEKTVEKKE